MNRLCIIGWDGATFDLIGPWIAKGLLPNLARVMAGGVHGPLRSTIPPWSFQAWSSFLTGKNPGKHGIYDFFRTPLGTYDLEFVNAGHRRGGASFWQLLSAAGRRVIAIGIPGTYPPDAVNGVMISGFDFPGEGPGSHIDARAVYPRSAHAELRRAVGPYPIDPPILKEMEQGRYDVALERILETIRQQAAHAKYLMQSRPWDCFMMVFGETDGVSHYFWQFFDRRSPFFTQQPPGLEDAILRVYQEVDRQTGELFALAPEGTLRMIVSDHGSGGISDWVLFPNRWLEGKGYCRLRTGAARGLSRLRERFKQWGVATIPSWLQRLLYRNAIGMLGRYEARVRYGILDWSGTQAYFDENPYYPVLRINLAGRQPQGIVAAQDYEPLRDRLIQDLESWRHPVTGAPLVEKAFRREEVYSGECLAEAADIVPKWALDDGQNYNFRISSKSPGPQWIARIDPQRRDGPYYPRKFSSHRDYAIFAAQGDAIAARGLTHGARIIDLAPTILNLFDVAVPTEMDGRALNDIFKGVSEALAVANGFPASAAPKERAIGTAGRDGPNLGRPLQSTSPVEPRR